MSQFLKTRISVMRVGSVVVLLFVGLVAGCGETGGVNLKVDPDLAKRSLTSFLETWSRGEKLEALEKANPRIIGRDPLWESGSKLNEYKIGKETSDGANLHIQVELKVAPEGDASEATTTQSVTYIVGTSPVITVFRDE